MPVTLKDIALRANVTTATVSMVINNKPNISESTREKVLRIAKELNYYPNAIARGLATKKTHAIGVVVPDLASTYVVCILQGIKMTNRDNEYTVQLFDTIGQKENEFELFKRLARERRVDGVILVDSVLSEEKQKELAAETIPCVVVSSKSDIVDCVFVNNEQGALGATEYLLKKGHKKIICVVCRQSNFAIDERILGYRKALEKYEIPYDEKLIFEVDDDTIDDGKIVWKKIEESGIVPDAIFVPAGDIAAVGVVKMVKRAGYNVPNDIAVVGYDDLPVAEAIDPSLTTVRQPKLEMGDNAVSLLIDKMEGRDKTLTRIELQTDFVIRNSA